MTVPFWEQEETAAIEGRLKHARQWRKDRGGCRPDCWCHSLRARLYYQLLLEDQGAIDESPTEA